MRQWDDSQDPDPNSGGDWFDQNQPPASGYPAQGGFTSLVEAVKQIYRTALGREAENDQVVQDWINGTGGDLAKIQQGIYATPEAQAYSQRQTAAGQAAPTANDPGAGGSVAPSGPGMAAAPIGVPTSGFGAAPTPYASNPDAPQYQSLGSYTAPQWTGGDYVAPTLEDLKASPGYQARLDDRLKADSRRFASQGTILNGGTVKALDRSAQDYATGEYQTLNANKYDQYKTRYAQFADAAGRDLASRSLNAADANTTFANRTLTYNNNNARTLSDYITNLNAKRNSELDYWSRLQDLNSTGANLAVGSR